MRCKQFKMPFAKICIGGAVVLIIILSGFFAVRKGWLMKENRDKASQTGVFSWEHEYMEKESAKVLGNLMNQLECSNIYQEIPSDIDAETLHRFMREQTEQGHQVYALSGQREWGVEEDGHSMLEIVEQVNAWNRRLPEQDRITGIMWDVEPYLLDEWDEDADAVMEQYVDNCIRSYKKAEKCHLTVLACIPLFYDRHGFEKQLERLIEKGCDGIAVMNYHKEDEIGQIETEVGLAREHNKTVIHITELQEPGRHELTEENTYYHDGIDAVWDSWREIEGYFRYEKLGFAWHYAKPAIEILEQEGIFLTG